MIGARPWPLNAAQEAAAAEEAAAREVAAAGERAASVEEQERRLAATQAEAGAAQARLQERQAALEVLLVWDMEVPRCRLRGGR